MVYLLVAIVSIILAIYSAVTLILGAWMILLLVAWFERGDDPKFDEGREGYRS